MSGQNIDVGVSTSSSQDCCFASYDVPLAVALNLKISTNLNISCNYYVVVQGIFTQIVFCITVINRQLMA
jgi:hypothetical protein